MRHMRGRSPINRICWCGSLLSCGSGNSTAAAERNTPSGSTLAQLNPAQAGHAVRTLRHVNSTRYLKAAKQVRSETSGSET
jgi:hypothetical protein